MLLFLKVKDTQVDLLPINHKNCHFSTKKIAKKWPRMAKIPILHIDPKLSCLISIQLTGMGLFFKIKELRVDLLPKSLKMSIFQFKKNGPKITANG